MTRGLLDCELITPNWFELMVVFGIPKTTWFRMLNASARNCTVMRSMGLNILKSEKSRFCDDGARTSGRVRATLPNVKAAGCENTEVLKYCLSLWDTGPSSMALWPLLLGRRVLMPQLTQVFCAVTEMGNPV